MKLLIVDDEVIIRTGLSTVIKWAELGYELLEPAASAEEALLRIEQEQPEIILTDIQMTGRSGLELAGEARRLLPDCEVIILTGYDQFSYAQQAIREGAGDYLLKTSRPDEIIRAVNGAKQRILQKWESLKRDQLRDRLFERLVEGTELDSRSEDKAAKLLPQLRMNEKSCYQAIIISAEGWGEAAGHSYLLLFAVHNMISELIEGEALLRNDSLVVLLRHESPRGDILQITRVLDRISRKLKCKLFAAAGSVVPDWRKMKASYAEATYTSLYKGITAEEGLLSYEDIRGRQGGRTVCSQEEEGQLTALFQEGDAAKLSQWVQKLIELQLKDSSTTPESLRRFLHSVQISAYRWVERVVTAYGDASMLSGVKLAHSTSPSSQTATRAETLFEQLNELMDMYRESVEQEGIPYIKRSIAYIHDHLDKELTLQQVAKHVHLNPNHFSEVFKRETGQTYIEFVTRMRMERAKRLLDESPIKVSEVAGRVGYADMKYFSQLFKRSTGYTPSEYRSRS
ncbi:helix-turn-helix domain-containing protein [Paenibacillus sp. FJAT-27812]|uniref:helix-turn-helix domain-containing protein n=1 Tax=Paenibacillus sp. FJAT-27812 TaxID=1684143 RepID=UPI0006A7A90E|nr:helix-turn-helix domain-containing protein [Paenibacillus sp. FJAT-27812]